MRLVVALLMIGMLIGAPRSVVADPGKPETSAALEDPKYVEGVNAVKRKDYAAAIPLFEAVVAKDNRNADAYNWLAYSIRQKGDAAKSIPIYEKALAINPKHRGAHEYIGEAFLALGNLPKAKEHLAVLNKLCFFPCEEYSDLKKAVQDHEASGGRIKPASKSN
ncbi:MAG: tetratricopeptide repeat protein [Candidatus Rokuibacteriota bacterium]